MKNTAITIFLFSLFSTFLIPSCSSGDRYDIIESMPEHEHDEISRIVLKFISKNDPTYIREFTYQAPEGTTEIPITNVNLEAGIYNVETYFYAAHGDHDHNVTDELFIDEGDDHFVFYQKVNNTGIDLVYADDDMVDTLGRKLGHRTVWTISSGGTGTIYLYLIHQPAVKDPNAPSAAQLGGEIDLESRFNIVTLN